MNNLLYVIAAILLVAWAIGYLGYHASELIHLLLLAALVAVILRAIKGNKIT
jgi:hypothetical protein